MFTYYEGVSRKLPHLLYSESAYENMTLYVGGHFLSFFWVLLCCQLPHIYAYAPISDWYL
jgi:hypothetical protein